MIAHARAKYEAHQRKVHLSERALRDRAIKGWETRRRNNPTLKNIHRIGKKDFEWRRPNGEKVPLRNFTADQVELVAPAMHVTDIHLKQKQKLHTSISVDPMRLHNFKAGFTGYRTGGDMMPLRAAGMGSTNPVRINKHSLKNPSPSFTPAGILTHEIGHLVGPGTDTYLGRSPHKLKGHSKKEVEHFEKSFQWEAPRGKPVKGRKNAFLLDRNGDLHPDVTNYESLWSMTGKHPQSIATYTKGVKKGLSRAWTEAYQTTNISEDFAETYRSTVGVPMDTKGKPKGVRWNWKDRKNMRRAYMEKTHLSKAARHNQYVKLIQEAMDRHDSE